MRTNAFIAVQDGSGQENLISRIKEEYPNILYLKVPGDIPEEKQDRICRNISDIIKNILSAAEDSYYGELDVPIGIVIDHSAGKGRIPHLEWYMSTNKSRNVNIILAAEDIKQIRDIYGDAAETIIFCFDRVHSKDSILARQEKSFQNWRRKKSLPVETMTIHLKHNLQHYLDRLKDLKKEEDSEK